MNFFAIDDTGSPGNTLESDFLKSDRKSYVAVYISESIIDQLTFDINQIKLKHCSETCQIEEFHFTDLINRRKEYKNLDTKQVKELFADFSQVLSKYSLPFFVQTITPRTLEENGLNKSTKSIDEIAIDFLLLRIIEFVNEKELRNKIKILVDEGLMKSGRKSENKSLQSITDDNFLYFKTSKESILIQVADYFAFGMNRHQLFAIKDKITDFDRFVINEINCAFEGNALSGVRPILIDKNGQNKKRYDEIQMEVLIEKGIFEYWKKSRK